MFDALSLTDYLALMFGVYLLVCSVGLVLDRDAYGEMIHTFRDNAALGYLAGVMAFVIGVVMVRLHNEWASGVACLVSALGWACLIEGGLILAFRRQFLNLFANLAMNRSLLMGISALCFLLGGCLIAFVLL